MEIAHTDVLPVIAEVSATFVGFSLAIGLLQPDQPGAKLPKQAMQSVAELAMISCAGALAVLVIQPIGFNAEVTWRIGSACTAIFWGATFSWAIIRYGAAGYPVFGDLKVTVAATLSVLGIGLFVFNAAVPTTAIDAIYIGGLFVSLVTAGYLFLLSTFLIGSNDDAT